MKNLKLATCMTIFAKHDGEMHDYLNGKIEAQLNMDEVSAYARCLRDNSKNKEAQNENC